MGKSFLPNLLFILAINLIIKPLYVFGVEVGVQNTLGASSYGLFFALLNSAYVLQIINDFGIQIFNNRQVSIRPETLQSLFPGLTYIKLGLSVLYTLLLVVLGLILGYRDVMGLFLLVGLNLILTSFILFIRSGISGLGYYKTDSILSALDKFLMIIVIGGMLLTLTEGTFSLLHFILGQSAALAITLLISLAILFAKGAIRPMRVPRQDVIKLMRQALPYALVVFLMTLYTRSDGVMIKALLPDGDYQAGVYAAGYRILDALNMVAFLFAVMLLPMFSKVLDSPRELSLLLDEGVRYMAALVIPVCLFGTLFSGEIMERLYIQADPYWSDVFVRLMITFLTTGVMYVFGTMLTAAGKVRAMNTVYLLTVLVNILLNFILIPLYKASGAASATLITQVFAALGILVLCIRLMPVHFKPYLLWRILCYAVACALCIWLLSRWGEGNLLVKLAVSGALSVFWGWVLGIIRGSELMPFIKGR